MPKDYFRILTLTFTLKMKYGKVERPILGIGNQFLMNL